MKRTPSIMQNETWKAIDGYEGYYEISNLGRVRSLDRLYYQKDAHGGMMVKHYYGKVMNPTDNGNGYLIISLNKNGRKSHYIHRLVANAFIPNPDGLSEVNHLDYNKQNNSVDNLEWVDRIENVHYSVDHMAKPKQKHKPTMTGEKYITKRNGLWRFSIRSKAVCFDRQYKTLEEAVKARAVIIGG